MALKLSLQLNAFFSLATGVTLTAARATVAGWLGVSIDGWLRLLGLALIGHGLVLLWSTRQDSIAAWAKLNVAAIAPYPVIMVALVATAVVDRWLGRGLLIADGAVVGLLALAQWTSLHASESAADPAPA